MAYFVPDLWHKQAIDLAGARGCVKNLDLWHRHKQGVLVLTLCARLGYTERQDFLWRQTDAAH
jgi:hypothetical protein